MFCKYINIIVYAIQNDRVRWYGFYNEREHECVGKVQLFLNYTTTSGEIGSAKVCAILVGVETTCMLLVYIYLCQGCPFVLGWTGPLQLYHFELWLIILIASVVACVAYFACYLMNLK
jgi:hypothetical protein